MVQDWYKPRYNGGVEQQLSIYRRHTKACIHGQSEPLYEADLRRKPDCSCVLNVVGYLRNELNPEGTPRRIRHKSLETNDWSEARRIREEMLIWGQLTAPASGLESFQGEKVTVEDAIRFFFECAISDGTKGKNTTGKYHQLLLKRLLPWCAQEKIRLVKRFDEPAIVRAFFNSWRKRKNINNQMYLESDVQLGAKTKRAILERYRTFLAFCLDSGWLKTNHAKKIKMCVADIPEKFAWIFEEYGHILRDTGTLERRVRAARATRSDPPARLLFDTSLHRAAPFGCVHVRPAKFG